MFVVGRMTGGANYRLVSSVVNNWLMGWWMGSQDTAHFDVSNEGEKGGPCKQALSYVAYDHCDLLLRNWMLLLINALFNRTGWLHQPTLLSFRPPPIPHCTRQWSALLRLLSTATVRYVVQLEIPDFLAPTAYAWVVGTLEAAANSPMAWCLRSLCTIAPCPPPSASLSRHTCAQSIHWSFGEAGLRRMSHYNIFFAFFFIAVITLIN